MSEPILLIDKISSSRRLQGFLPEFVPRDQEAGNFWGTGKSRTQVNQQRLENGFPHLKVVLRNAIQKETIHF